MVINTKDGKKYAYGMTEEMKRAIDNPQEVEKYAKEQAKVLREMEKAMDSSAPLKKVEVEAQYPGDSEGWKAYLFKSLNYPEAAVKHEVQGEVIVEFVVNIDGSVKDIHAISGPEELRAESVRIIRESGHWVPATEKGVRVASYKKQPIVYKLEEK